MHLEPVDTTPATSPSDDRWDEPKGFVTDEEGEAMAEAAVNLFRRWGVTDAEAMTLLGGIGKSTYARWKHGQFGRLGTDTKARLASLMAVHADLRTFFVENEDAYAFVKRENDLLDGRRPLDIMLRGQMSDLFRVRRFVGAMVHGGW